MALYLITSLCAAQSLPAITDEPLIVGIQVSNVETRWIMWFDRDGSVTAIYGADIPTKGDAAGVPRGSVHFDALFNAVLRLRVPTQICNTRVSFRYFQHSQGERLAGGFCLADDNLLQYLMDSLEGKWQPFPLSKFHTLKKLYPFFPGSDDSSFRVAQWGTMHETLTEGRTEKRLLLSDLKDQHGLVGVGALEGLAGEITIYEGKIWLSRGEARAVEATDEWATLLVAAPVTQWNEVQRESKIAADQLEAVIREAAERSGLDTSKPFPFVIEGRLTVQAHVVRGACPLAGAGEAPQPPIRFSIGEEPGTLIGFFAQNREGTLTHLGTSIHAHVLTREQPPRTGHVDSAALASGSTIRFPKPRE